ncbi:CD151 antigen-like [Melanotaenia boesemani]|uniref:CD151 antigen-like n=1 Tax=Melanotaenia boesemani TaxID=1250792 RepID=UPI001C03CAE9|nr:CD151 antigen-like [Melanotaenia boesemani]
MCGFCSIKCCFIFFNTLFLASGIALIIIGALQYSTYSQMAVFAGNSLSHIALVLIAVGVTITIISLLGHFGAFINNSSMVACFICILIVIILLELLTGTAFYIFRSRTALLQMNQMNSAMTNKARQTISEYSPEKRHAVNRIQEKLKCCGADGADDWSHSMGWQNYNAVPDSCCKVRSEGCGQDKTKIYKKGCLLAIKLFLLKNFVWVGAVCISLGVTEVFGVVVGLFLCLDIKRKNYANIS